MSKLPQIRRLLVEDFLDQKDWIAKLFTPLNTFMDNVVLTLSRGITIRENMAGDIVKVTLSAVPSYDSPFPVQWQFSSSPLAVIVGNVQNQDLTDFTLAAGAVGVQWKWNTTQGLRLVNLFGLTPTSISPYTLTLVIFGG